MPAVETYEAIVVGLQDYREADRIVRLLTAERGRVDALARRARSSRRRFAGALETGNHIRVHLKRGRGSLDFIEDAELVDARLHTRTDLDRIALAAFACELCASPARLDSPEPKLYGLLQTALVVLDACSAPPTAAFRAGLATKAATFAGLRPQLSTCRVCGAPSSAPMVWAPLHGGAAHVACDAIGQRVHLDWLQAVEQCRRTPLRELVDAPLPEGPLQSLTHAIENQLGRPLQSRRLLDQLTAAPDVPPAR